MGQKYLLTILMLFGFLCTKANELRIAEHRGDSVKIEYRRIIDCSTCFPNCDLPEGIIYNVKNDKQQRTFLKTGETPFEIGCMNCHPCIDSNCNYNFNLIEQRFEAWFPTDANFRLNDCLLRIEIHENVYPELTNLASGKTLLIELEFNPCIKNISPSERPNLGLNALGKDAFTNLKGNEIDIGANGGYSDRDSNYFSPLLKPNRQIIELDDIYSYNKPLYYLGFPRDSLEFPRGIHLNGSDLRFRPMKDGTFLIPMQVEEWRSDTFMSRSTRNYFSFVFKATESNPPVISGMNCKKPKAANFKTTAVAGEKICFTICTSDKEKNDTVKIWWNEGIPGGEFKVLNPGDKHKTGQFCWTPELKHVSKFPYSFVVRAQSGGCHFPQIAVRSFQIRVKAPPSIQIDEISSNCGKLHFEFRNVESRVGIAQWLIDIGNERFGFKGSERFDTTIGNFKSGTYPIAIYAIGDNGGNGVAYDTLTISQNAPIFDTRFILDNCKGATSSLHLDSSLAPNATVLWPDSSRATQRTFTMDSTYEVIFKASLNSCEETGTVFIKAIDFNTDFGISNPSGSAPLTVNFGINSEYGADSVEWFINGVIQNNRNSSYLNYTFTNPGKYDVKLVKRNKEHGCADSTLKTAAVDVFPTGIHVQSSVSIFPNPASNAFQINRESTKRAVFTVRDLNGKEIFTTVSNSAQLIIKCNNWPAGIYQLEIAEGDQVGVYQLIHTE